MSLYSETLHAKMKCLHKLLLDSKPDDIDDKLKLFKTYYLENYHRLKIAEIAVGHFDVEMQEEAFSKVNEKFEDDVGWLDNSLDCCEYWEAAVGELIWMIDRYD